MTHPERPRLADHIHCARVVTNGEPRVMLRDFRSGTSVEIDEARYQLLTFADGTRDLDGLCLACARAGIYGGEAGIREFLSELSSHGLLVDGLPAPEVQTPVAPPSLDGSRTLEALPDYSFRCDGAGSCCRFYGMIAFSADEAVTARATLRGRRLPLESERHFTPYRGAQAEPGEPLVVAQVDGRCLYLHADGGCELHRAGNAESKPQPCRLFPRTFVDDGDRVRVSVAPECACAFRSARSRVDAAVPLIPTSARTFADLPAAPWQALPSEIPLDRGTVVSPAELRAASHTLIGYTEASEDPARAAFALSRRLTDRLPRLGDQEERPGRGPTPDRGDVDTEHADAWLARLHERAVAAVGFYERVTSEADLSLRTARWIAEALAEVDAQTLLDATPSDPTDERFYLRALIFGHRIATGGRPLAFGFFDRGVRLLAARAMAARPMNDPAADIPLALLEAAMRNLQLSDYADGLAWR